MVFFVGTVSSYKCGFTNQAIPFRLGQRTCNWRRVCFGYSLTANHSISSREHLPSIQTSIRLLPHNIAASARQISAAYGRNLNRKSFSVMKISADRRLIGSSAAATNAPAVARDSILIRLRVKAAA
jgi:hypothetical protein